MEENIKTYLTFALGKENFALDVEQVEKILEYQPVTVVPKAPEYLLGVFNLRGDVIPLVDTRIKFGMKKSEIKENTVVLVIVIQVEGEQIRLGAMVDSVNEVIKHNDDDVIALPTVGKQNKSEFIKGVIQEGERFILILNADKIFSVDEIVDLRLENLGIDLKA